MNHCMQHKVVPGYVERFQDFTASWSTARNQWPGTGFLPVMHTAAGRRHHDQLVQDHRDIL